MVISEQKEEIKRFSLKSILLRENNLKISVGDISIRASQYFSRI